jgi:hypothetical protein
MASTGSCAGLRTCPHPTGSVTGGEGETRLVAMLRGPERQAGARGVSPANGNKT